MIEQLLHSTNPIIRYKTRLLLLDEDPFSPAMETAQLEIKYSPFVMALLSDRNEDGLIPFHPYAKWQGAHWVLTCLADCAYPTGDTGLAPLHEQVFNWLLSAEHVQGFQKRTGKNRQVRLHASMEANALFASLALGLADERDPLLVDRLLWAQWEDGGWNCDRRSKADSSSFYESITPLRALVRWSIMTGEPKAHRAAERAAEIFLERRLFRRLSSGELIKPEFARLHYPIYHYYDILTALKFMTEAGWINDPRCQAALEQLEEKQLPGGGFAAEDKHYVVCHQPGICQSHASRVAWGETHRGQPNEFVTLDALYVLKSAGRLSVL